jgi:hypothetical protein
MCKRYLYVHHKVPSDDETLKIEMDALHILNPPPKYEKKIESSEESDSSIKEMKRESKRVKRSEIIEHIRQ